MKNTEVATLFKTIAESFQALSEIYSSNTEEITQHDAEATNEQVPTAAEATEHKTYKKEDVRAELAKKAKVQNGKYKNVVKDLVAKYSSDGTLTKVPEDKYQDLMSELEVLGNA